MPPHSVYFERTKTRKKKEKFDSGMYVEYRDTRKDPERSLS